MTSEIPNSVTQRGVREVLRTFADSDWTGMTLEIGGMRIAVGKHGPPAGAAAPPPPAAAPGTAAPAAGAVTSAAGKAAPAAGAVAPGAGAVAPAAAPETTGLVEVRSPAVGSFWVAPSPGQPPFVEVGQVVAEHEQLAIVEVMKLMNPVIAPAAGEVVRVCAANAEMVEYDQVLFLVRPADA